MTSISLGSIELEVFEQGAGRPLVLVHGFPLDHTMWRQQFGPLASGFRLLAPDLRGFGRSGGTPGVVTMEQFADDLARMLDVLEIDEKVALCGLSMGGYVAWQFWRRHRARLSHLILCDTRAVADPAEVARGRLQMAERVIAQGASVAVESLLPRLFAPATHQSHPERVQAVRDVILATDPQAIAAAQRGMAQRLDMTSHLGEIQTPTLVVCGEHDEISRAAEMREFAAAIPGARFVEIPGAGHMAPLENPQAFNQALVEFLS